MRPVDIAQTAILEALTQDPRPRTEKELIGIVNAHAPDSPVVAMEPARVELFAREYMEEVQLPVRQGFFGATIPAYGLTAKGEGLAARVLKGMNEEELRAQAVFALLSTAQENGYAHRDHVRALNGVGPATLRRTFDQLADEGVLSQGVRSQGLFGAPVGYLTQKGRDKLLHLTAAALA